MHLHVTEEGKDHILEESQVVKSEEIDCTADNSNKYNDRIFRPQNNGDFTKTVEEGNLSKN